MRRRPGDLARHRAFLFAEEKPTSLAGIIFSIGFLIFSRRAPIIIGGGLLLLLTVLAAGPLPLGILICPSRWRSSQNEQK